MFHKHVFLLLILFSIIGLVGAILVPSPVIPNLSGNQRAIIDSMVEKQRIAINPPIDSVTSNMVFPVTTINSEENSLTSENMESNSLSTVNLIKNGDFERPITPKCIGHMAFFDGDRINEWIVLSHSVDLDNYWNAANGSQSVDLSGDASGGLSQSISTVKGKKYKLSFNYAGNPDDKSNPIKKFRVLWGKKIISTLSFDVSSTSKLEMGWKYYETIIKATNTVSTITFQDISQNDKSWGPVIDNVKLIRVYSTGGIISLSSNPPGAQIFIDNVDTGSKTPQTISGISPGQHTVLLKKDGYQDWTKNVIITAGMTTQISATLSSGGNNGSIVASLSSPELKEPLSGNLLESTPLSVTTH